MNCLSLDRKTHVLKCLVEGNSIRSTERMTGIHRDTIMRLLNTVGYQCIRFLDEKITDITVRQLQVDEIWAFVYKKQKRVNGHGNALEMGDQYIFVALDADTKLVPSFMVGKRTGEIALLLMQDLQWRFSFHFSVICAKILWWFLCSLFIKFF